MSEELTSLGVGLCAVPVAAPTRICTTLVAGPDATEIVEPAGPMSPSEIARFMREVERQGRPEVLVLSGSLAPGVTPSLYRDLTRRAGCPVVVDACGPELLLALEARPLVAKPNRAELEVTLGRSLDSDAAIHSAMRHLATQGAQWVVVSDGSRPLWLLGHDTLCSLRASPLGRVVNPIGSGDCLAAGIAVGVARGLSVPDAVELGVRAAVSNLQTLLPVRSDTGGLLSGIEAATLTFEHL